MRENEEAQRLEDEAEAGKVKGHEEAASARQNGEMPQELQHKQVNGEALKANKHLHGYHVNGAVKDPELEDSHRPAADGSSLDHEKARKQEVLSH